MRKIKASKIGEKHYQVDMRGWVCPYPKYAVELLVKKLDEGNRMNLLVDCPSATEDVPKVARSIGCEVPEVTQINNGEWQIVIIKKQDT